MYINGELDATAVTTNLSGITTTNDLRIGNYSQGTIRSFDGAIGDVRIYNIALTGDEVKQLYKRSKRVPK